MTGASPLPSPEGEGFDGGISFAFPRGGRWRRASHGSPVTDEGRPGFGLLPPPDILSVAKNPFPPSPAFGTNAICRRQILPGCVVWFVFRRSNMLGSPLRAIVRLGRTGRPMAAPTGAFDGADGRVPTLRSGVFTLRLQSLHNVPMFLWLQHLLFLRVHQLPLRLGRR